MLRDLFFVILVYAPFLNAEATMSSFGVHPKAGVSLSRSSLLTNIDPVINGVSSDRSEHVYFATYTANTPPRNGYSGGMATMDVYSFPNRRSGDRIATVMWISNDDINIIEAGWLVEPSRYGDSKSHFFVAWTAGGFGGKPAGCFDLDCNGFVPVNGAPITPGDTLELVNGQAKISFKIFKNRDDGDWWLHFGQDVNNLHPVGFWPKSLFNKMENHANIITWGGHTRCDGVNPSPPMGNGQWPGKNSASIQNIQFVDTDGRGYAVPAWALKVDSGNKKCYQASPFINSMFYYGGPGGCTN